MRELNKFNSKQFHSAYCDSTTFRLEIRNASDVDENWDQILRDELRNNVLFTSIQEEVNISIIMVIGIKIKMEIVKSGKRKNR